MKSRNFEELVGLAEDEFFEAKRPSPYPLGTPQGRYELAKDVSSFANSGGGYIVVGLETRKPPEEAIDIVSGILPIAETEFEGSAYFGIIRTLIFPLIDGLSVMWVEDAEASGTGLGFISIPPQAPGTKPFIITRVVDGDESLKQIIVGYAVRKGSSSEPSTAAGIQQTLRKGLTPSSERLDRIEQQLSVLVENCTRSAAKVAPPKPGIDGAKLWQRIDDILRA